MTCFRLNAVKLTRHENICMTPKFLPLSQWKQSFTTWLVVKLIVSAIRILGLTSKHIYLNSAVPEEALGTSSNYILSMWHQSIFGGAWELKNRHLSPMISQSKDGEFIAQALEHFGFSPIRGSSSAGGTQALRQMIKYLKGAHPAVITSDGPRGPIHEVKPGIITMAKMSKMPIIPWDYVAIEQGVVHKSWDQHKIPKLFTIVVSSFGKPFHVPSTISSDDIPLYCKKLEQAMQANHEQIQVEIERLKQQGASTFWGKLRLILFGLQSS
ncbi:MAG: lysophospholipid acyltransferase (LPLAT)-like uncharacterized protein [Candidatus Endobugula sp.]